MENCVCVLGGHIDLCCTLTYLITVTSVHIKLYIRGAQFFRTSFIPKLVSVPYGGSFLKSGRDGGKVRLGAVEKEKVEVEAEGGKRRKEEG
jgi:hypothetical protein